MTFLTSWRPGWSGNLLFLKGKIQGDVQAVVVVQHWCTKWTQKPHCHYYFIHSHIKLQNMHALLWFWFILKLHTPYLLLYFLFILIGSLLVHTSTTAHYTAHPKTPKGDLKCTTQARYSQHFEKPSTYSNSTNNIQNGKLICKQWTAYY